MNMGGGQDWDTVVIRKKKPTTAQLKDESAVNAVGDRPHPPIMLARLRPYPLTACVSPCRLAVLVLVLRLSRRVRLPAAVHLLESAALSRVCSTDASFSAFAIAVGHTQTSSGKAAHKLEAETEDFHRE
jgi:hypothetical protein